jgi:hypothetical protein
MTHLKAKPKTEILKIDEVQEAMTSALMKDKDSWLNEAFMAKLMAKPHLMAAFSDP